jgi:phosphoribosyl-ATP pyrophosphohydrolase/phosphoribosyl-AMP cyclohydrolase/histidinol dehydrogenase
MRASPLLPRRTVAKLARRGAGFDAKTRAAAARIVEAVRTHGEVALRKHAERFGDVLPDAPLYHDRPELARALTGLSTDDRVRLERVAARIRAFAVAQRGALGPVSVPVPGGVAEHRIAPMQRAGCYAPGGRYPLPSSVLMTAVTARVAGVRDIWVASPKPQGLTLAAAALAGADGVLAVGGAQAIAALAYGTGPIAPRDVIVGPGNRYVAAAKRLVAGAVAIDMLAGPSELVVFADSSADAATVAVDLLAQAEHDPHAVPVLVTTDASLVERVERELARCLGDLPTARVARAALAHGGAIVVSSVDDGVAACDALAPEHLQLVLRDADAVAPRLAHYGALFVGAGSAEVLGDYGAGPNHVLPTGGTARFSGGLSVYTFLRVRTWLRIDDPAGARQLIEDALWLGRAEGLEAHARAAERRLVAGPARKSHLATQFPTP